MFSFYPVDISRMIKGASVQLGGIGGAKLPKNSYNPPKIWNMFKTKIYSGHFLASNPPPPNFSSSAANEIMCTLVGIENAQHKTLRAHRAGRICWGTGSPRSGCPGTESAALGSSAGRPTAACWCWPCAGRVAAVGTPASDTRPAAACSGFGRTTRHPPSGTTWVTRRVAWTAPGTLRTARPGTLPPGRGPDPHPRSHPPWWWGLWAGPVGPTTPFRCNRALRPAIPRPSPPSPGPGPALPFRRRCPWRPQPHRTRGLRKRRRRSWGPRVVLSGPRGQPRKRTRPRAHTHGSHSRRSHSRIALTDRTRCTDARGHVQKRKRTLTRARVPIAHHRPSYLKYVP